MEAILHPAPPLSVADLARVLPIVRREARRALHRRGLPQQERDDLQQDMLVDLLARMPAFDSTRGTLEAFTTVCCRHHATRQAERLRRERAHRHIASFDDRVGTEESSGAPLTLGETLSDQPSTAWRASAASRLALRVSTANNSPSA